MRNHQEWKERNPDLAQQLRDKELSSAARLARETEPPDEVFIRMSPSLGDGQHHSFTDDMNVVLDAVAEWLRDASSGDLCPGEKVTLEVLSDPPRQRPPERQTERLENPVGPDVRKIILAYFGAAERSRRQPRA